MVLKTQSFSAYVNGKWQLSLRPRRIIDSFLPMDSDIWHTRRNVVCWEVASVLSQSLPSSRPDVAWPSAPPTTGCPRQTWPDKLHHFRNKGTYKLDQKFKCIIGTTSEILGLFLTTFTVLVYKYSNLIIQVSLVICGSYVPDN